VSNTNLFAAGPGSASGLVAKLTPLFVSLIAQSDAQGAWPTLCAATMPQIRGGSYYGPDGFREMRGYPVEVRAEAQAYDESLAGKLWEVSEQLTGVQYALPA
jgi:hypothetical protein